MWKDRQGKQWQKWQKWQTMAKMAKMAKMAATPRRRKEKLSWFSLLTIKQTYFIITNSQVITGGFI